MAWLAGFRRSSIPLVLLPTLGGCMPEADLGDLPESAPEDTSPPLSTAEVEPAFSLLGRCFRLRRVLGPVEGWLGGLGAGDLDGDGAAELILDRAVSPAIEVRLGGPGFPLELGWTLPEYHLDVVDVDGDGLHDLVSNALVRFSSPDHGFVEVPITEYQGFPFPGRYRGGPGSDLAFMSEHDGFELRIVGSDPSAPRTLIAHEVVYVPDGLAGSSIVGQGTPVAGDFDGDGLADLAYGDAATQVVFAAPGGRFEDPLTHAWNPGTYARRWTHAGDVDGDGIDELLLAGSPEAIAERPMPTFVTIASLAGRSLSILDELGFAFPFEVAAVDEDRRWSPWLAVVVHDLDQDDRPDLLAVQIVERERDGQRLAVTLLHAARGHGDGTFEPPEAIVVASTPIGTDDQSSGADLIVADLDGSGGPELVLSHGTRRGHVDPVASMQALVFAPDGCGDRARG